MKEEGALLTISLHAIAPYKIKTIYGKQKAPWRKAASVTAQKIECSKAEHIWRKTKLHIHHDHL